MSKKKKIFAMNNAYITMQFFKRWPLFSNNSIFSTKENGTLLSTKINSDFEGNKDDELWSNSIELELKTIEINV